MARGNGSLGGVALVSRNSGVRCLVEDERDLLLLHQVLARRPEQYLHPGAVASTQPISVFAASCARKFTASQLRGAGSLFSSTDKEVVGQALYALAVISDEPIAEVLFSIDAELAKLRSDFEPDEEDAEDLIRELLREEGLDEYELEDAIFDRDRRYHEAYRQAAEDLCDLELAPALELSQYLHDLWHALGANRAALLEPLPTPAEARLLRQEADRLRAEWPQAA